MKKLGEFERIAHYFSPLVAGQSDALGLADDAAIVSPPPGMRMAVTADALVAGVHFLESDPADRVARKALRVNISDLAAMGADPYGYTITLALPSGMENAEAWLEAFASGQRSDHLTFGIRLLGGDSVSTPGPLTISVTAFGWIPEDRALLRSGARAGDDIFVSGTIGDSGLGLAVLRSEIADIEGPDRGYLVDRYQLPEPRPMLGRALLRVASAALDVSDGLVQDLGHIAKASGVAANIALPRVPVSAAAAALVRSGKSEPVNLIASGDDYELLFTAPKEAREAVLERAEEAGVPICRIGKILPGRGVYVVDEVGNEVAIERRGYTHA
ncbi:thiamine-phosphate kinase [Nisaea acidiphila]|uniref:Thiamine-monophosphate kinase n=1 Tax=Nisaea acidiphila TaxID=1862145 RepID=A0A9J7ATR3_9PROT|nr:thiamine-phosphate kinase [Nisaea acidiphila]UUX50226.1 thiamine-phosphate kinase [Nisaea acidiphila]